MLWSLPAGGAPPGAAQTCRWPENEMIVLLQREGGDTSETVNTDLNLISHLQRL